MSPTGHVLYACSPAGGTILGGSRVFGGEVYLQEAGPGGGQALGAYPWCFLSHFLLPVIHGMSTFPLPQAPATCHRVLPWSTGCRQNLRSHQVKESFPPLSRFSWGFWSFQQKVSNSAYSGGFHQKATCSSRC